MKNIKKVWLNSLSFLDNNIINSIIIIVLVLYSSGIFENINYHAFGTFFGYVADESIKIILDDQSSVYKWFSVDDKSLYPFVRKMIDELRQKTGNWYKNTMPLKEPTQKWRWVF